MELQTEPGPKFVLIVLCLFSFSLDLTKEFEQPDVEVGIWYGDNYYTNTTGLLVIKVGTDLRINCSVSNGSGKDIAWRNGPQWLDSKSTLLSDNKTVQLKIGRVLWNLNGTIYWCGLRNVKQIYGSRVMVIVGDIPSAPNKHTFKIVGLDEYEIHITWRAASYTGYLPTYYTVTYLPCVNKTFCKGTPRYQFCQIRHHPGKLDYSCMNKRIDMLNHSSMRDLYRVSIATVNVLGESKSPEFYLNADYGEPGSGILLLPTPKPPLDLSVISNHSNSIVVQWRKRLIWHLKSPNFTLLYHKDTDRRNKTKEITTIQSMVTLTEGIEPYSVYYIYIMSVYVQENAGGVSDVVGPAIVRTQPGTPDRGPGIQNVSSIQYPNDPSKRNVSVSWVIPKSSWKGRPSYVKVSYRSNSSQPFKVKKLYANLHSLSKIVLTALDSFESYTCHISLCNHVLCGDKGPLKHINYISGTTFTSRTDDNGILYPAIGVACGIGLLISVAIGLCLIQRFIRKNRVRKLSLDENIGPVELNYTDNYSEIPTNDTSANEYEGRHLKHEVPV